MFHRIGMLKEKVGACRNFPAAVEGSQNAMIRPIPPNRGASS
jgi:hypothetical protein